MQSEIRAEIYREIEKERIRQHEKWGEQNYPLMQNFPGSILLALEASDAAKQSCEKAAAENHMTWYDILCEEFCEIFAAPTEDEQITELIQTAAVCVQMIECIKRNRK